MDSQNPAEDPVDPQAELVDPAVTGTLNVLATSKRFGVGRVVLTSSISAMVPNPGWSGGRVFDESSWTVLDYCKLHQKWYPVSKTLAEKAYWDFANKNGSSAHGGDKSSYMSRPTLATWSERQLCSLETAAGGVEGYAGFTDFPVELNRGWWLARMLPRDLSIRA